MINVLLQRTEGNMKTRKNAMKILCQNQLIRKNKVAVFKRTLIRETIINILIKYIQVSKVTKNQIKSV